MISVYMNIFETSWKAVVVLSDQCIEIGGEEKEDDVNRHALVCTLELLQFLRNWFPEESFSIITNNQFSFLCVEKWIPLWSPKGFRINHTSKLRPHTDLLVKIYAFSTCMKFQFVQHYNDFESYHELFPQPTHYTNQYNKPPNLSSNQSSVSVHA